MYEMATGVALNLLLGFAAFIKRSVTLDGFIAGFLVGLCIYVCGGIALWLILVSFFVSSSLFSIYKKGVKDDLKKIHEKGGQRDYIQVLANSLVSCLYVLLYCLSNNQLYVLLFLVAFATSTADTWASELGVLSKKEPILITSFKKVQRGISGGVSMTGTLASLFGAFFIASIFLFINTFYSPIVKNAPLFFVLVVAGGFLGSLIDSLLGATLQAQYQCAEIGILTEKKYSHGKVNQHVKGFAFINNDGVNFLSSLASTAVIFIMYIVTM